MSGFQGPGAAAASGPPTAPPQTGGQRPTEIGAFSVAPTPGSRTRVIPVPWIDCEQCAWRHYPSTNGGRWHIATACASCGAALSVPGIAPA